MARTSAKPCYSLLAALLFSALSLFAQTPDIDINSPLHKLEHKTWTNIGQTQLNRIFAVEQDSIGYLWIGSDKGLLRFDGAQLVKYNMRNTPLRTETVVHVGIGNQGIVYYGTRRGLYRLKDGVSKELLDEQGEHVTMTISFLVDKDGRLWLTTRRNQLYYEEDGVLVAYNGGNTEAIRLFKGKDDQLYATTNSDRGSLFKFHPDTGMERLPFQDAKGLYIRAVTTDKKGTIYWINELGEAWKWDGLVTTQLCGATDNNYFEQHILLGEEGDLWFGYDKLHRLLPDGTLEQFGEDEGLTDKVVRDIYADAHGDVWIATLYGLNRLSNSPFHSLVGPDWPDVREHSILQAPDDALLVGTYDDGLYWLKEGEHKKVEHPSLSKKIQTMAFDKAGNLVIGQANGLFRFSYSEGKISEKEQLFSGYVKMLHVAGNNDYIFAVRSGPDGKIKVYRNGSVLDIDYPGYYYIWMTDGPDDTVWLGTRKGLHQWDGSQMKPTDYEDYLFDVFMTAYTPLANGGNWIGSYGTGFARIQDGKAYPFSTQNGLPVNQAAMLLQTEPNSVWLYVGDRHFGKVTHLTPFYEEESHQMVQGETYRINEEIVDDQDERGGDPFLLQQVDRERAVLLGVNGPFSFEPARVRLAKPIVRIEAVVVADSVYDPTIPLSLKAGARNIEFHFGAIDYYRGANQQFEYRLTGYDSDWQNTGSRTTAYFSNLPEGEFQFEVRVLLPDGTYEQSGQIVQVIQQEFWYKQGWAIWLFMLALIGLVSLLFRIRLATIKKQRNLLQEKVAQRTHELNELNHTLEEKVESRTQELADTEERYRYALDAADDGIFDWDLPRDNMKLSPAIYTMLGHQPYEFAENRQAILDQVHADDRESVDNLELLLTRVRDTRYLKHEFRMVQKDRSVIWVRLKAKVFERDPDLNPIRVVGTLNDITAEKQKTQEILDAVLKTENLERGRISKEIHDGLQQTLMLAKMNFRKVQQDLDHLPEESAEKFETGFKFLDTSINESRAVAHDLMPKAIVDFGIIPAMESLIDHMDKAAEETEFHFHHNFKTSKLDNQQIELTLYRIVQECLNNVTKYAQAKQVNVQLMEYEDVYVLTVEDDGVGFDMESAKQKEGMGFKSMKNRLDAIHGFIEVSSRPGKGVSIVVEIKKNIT